MKENENVTKQDSGLPSRSLICSTAASEKREAENAGSTEWLNKLDSVAASYGFPPVRNCVDYTTQEYVGKTPEQVFQEDWLDYAENDE